MRIAYLIPIVLILWAAGCGKKGNDSSGGTEATQPSSPTGADKAGREAGTGRAGEPRRATEFDRFAEYATMESFQNEIAFDRYAPWRDRKLRAQSWNDPALKDAV